MSSKYLELAWLHRTLSMEEKLLLVALAELADRDGSFITQISELQTMMCASERAIDNLLGKLTLEQTLVGLNKSTAAYRNQGQIKGRLNLTPAATSVPAAPYHSQREFEQRQQTNYPTKGISHFHGSQIQSLNKNKNTKMINIQLLSPNVVEDWAEIVMHRSGYGGQTNIWAAFVARIKEIPHPNGLYSLDELTSRLHAHLHAEKSFNTKKQTTTIKRSAIDMLEEKISNFSFKEDPTGEHK